MFSGQIFLFVFAKTDIFTSGTLVCLKDLSNSSCSVLSAYKPIIYWYRLLEEKLKLILQNVNRIWKLQIKIYKYIKNKGAQVKYISKIFFIGYFN